MEKVKKKWNKQWRYQYFEVVTEAHAMKACEARTWPPRWFETNESIMRRWEWAMKKWSIGPARGVLRAIYFAHVTSLCLRSCVSDILLDICKQSLYEKDYEIAKLCVRLVYYLSFVLAAGIDGASNSPRNCCELSVALLAMEGLNDYHMEGLNDYFMELNLEALYRMIDGWPELSELLEGTETARLAVARLQQCRESLKEGIQMYAIMILIRVPYSIGVRLPVDGQTGNKRLRILDKMDQWVWEGHEGQYDMLEKELDIMKRNGVRSDDVALWESFLEYLRRFGVVREDWVFMNGGRILLTWQLFYRKKGYRKWSSSEDEDDGKRKTD
jgi:hypothetical protein